MQCPQTNLHWQNYSFNKRELKECFLATDFVTVTKDDNFEWEELRAIICATLMEFYSSGQPVVLEDHVISRDTEILPTDSEAVAMIKELMETRIKIAVQNDGGDIKYVGFHDGVVFVKLEGSCSGCKSSSVTLKQGIERMLMHWVPEVSGVMEVQDEEEYKRLIGETTGEEGEVAPDRPKSLSEVNTEAIKKLEEKIDDKS